MQAVAEPTKGHTWGRTNITKVLSETAERKKAEKEALLEAMLLGKNKDWEGLVNKGLAFPTIMDRLCSSFYRLLPDEFKYTLPVKWYMNGGKCADSVLKAMSKAGKYKPEKWIGKGILKSDKGIDVYIGTKCPIDEIGKQIAWATTYEAAYLQAQLISGRVFRGFIDVSDIIAIDVNSVESILQYGSIIGAEQIFPKLPVSLI